MIVVLSLTPFRIHIGKKPHQTPVFDDLQPYERFPCFEFSSATRFGGFSGFGRLSNSPSSIWFEIVADGPNFVSDSNIVSAASLPS
ncbi:hypothetical protein LINPERPRIM_LOCUS203 [Linum perenne]